MSRLFDKILKPQRLRIVCNGHPALRRVSSPITVVDDEIRQLAARMIVTMQENEVVGVGLAAPQVGVNLRLIVIDTYFDDEESKTAMSAGEILLNPRMPLALVNPEIISYSEEKCSSEEGCLSLPEIHGDVERPARVMLSASTLEGEKIMVECGSLLARCLQHEIDHLNGVLFYDKLSEKEQKIADPQMKELEKREKALL